MERLRIMHIIEGLSLGGAERRLVNDLKFINKLRFENAVCVLFNRLDLEKEVSVLNVPLYKLNLRNSADFPCFFKLLKLIKSFNPDIIHTQLFWADILGRAAAKISGVSAVVSTVQSSVYEPESGYLFSRKRKLLDRITGMIINGNYIAVSEFVKKSIVRRLKIKEGKVRVIYNYVDSSGFEKLAPKAKDRLRNRLGLSEEDIVMSTVGRLNPPKGHHFLLEALAILRPEFPTLKLLIIGDGPSRNMLEECARRLGIEREAVFLGMRPDVQELVQISDVFVFPTLSEGMPISLLEAMAMQMPCVASAIGPILEVINDGENGYLFSPGDSQGLASVLRGIFKSRDKMEEVGLKGAISIRDKFSAAEAVERLSALYEELCARENNN